MTHTMTGVHGRNGTGADGAATERLSRLLRNSSRSITAAALFMAELVFDLGLSSG
jgi:hypothetical protein